MLSIKKWNIGGIMSREVNVQFNTNQCSSFKQWQLLQNLEMRSITQLVYECWWQAHRYLYDTSLKEADHFFFCVYCPLDNGSIFCICFLPYRSTCLSGFTQATWHILSMYKIVLKCCYQFHKMVSLYTAEMFAINCAQITLQGWRHISSRRIIKGIALF